MANSPRWTKRWLDLVPRRWLDKTGRWVLSSFMVGGGAWAAGPGVSSLQGETPRAPQPVVAAPIGERGSRFSPAKIAHKLVLALNGSKSLLSPQHRSHSSHSSHSSHRSHNSHSSHFSSSGGSSPSPPPSTSPPAAPTPSAPKPSAPKSTAPKPTPLNPTPRPKATPPGVLEDPGVRNPAVEESLLDEQGAQQVMIEVSRVDLRPKYAESTRTATTRTGTRTGTGDV